LDSISAPRRTPPLILQFEIIKRRNLNSPINIKLIGSLKHTNKTYVELGTGKLKLDLIECGKAIFIYIRDVIDSGVKCASYSFYDKAK
jgi:hypothetical protein